MLGESWSRAAAVRSFPFVALLLLGAQPVAPIPISSTSPASGGDSIFAEDFESGDLTGWDRGVGAPPGSTLPPDPATIAPPLNPTAAVDIFDSNRFLWQGADPVQVGVAPGALDPARLSLLRGRVFDEVGLPLRGARVSVLGHPNLGSTRSRADGVYDLAVNGEGHVVLQFEKIGYLTVFRAPSAAALDFGEVADVVLLRRSVESTQITSNATEMQVARGEVSSDIDGSRQATLLFPSGAGAVAQLPGGGTQPLAALTVRATEFTIGSSGIDRMPAPLPDNTGYTYAVEFSVDEADALGAERVDFDQPVVFYLENFLEVAVGEPVPVGYLDRSTAQWLAEPNGIVLQILSIAGGVTELDVDGSGQPADPAQLAALGVSQDELQRLALLYTAGQSLWRVAVSHFTPYDCNWPYGPPEDAEAPPVPEYEADPPEGPPDFEEENPDDESPDDPCSSSKSGSILLCESQILGEEVPLVGTPFQLVYRSDRTLGRAAPKRIRLRLSRETVPASLASIRLRVWAAGVLLQEEFAPQPDLWHEIEWTSLDRFGRLIHSSLPVTVEIGYVYPAVYFSSVGDLLRAFSRFPTAGVSGGFDRQTARFTLWRKHQFVASAFAVPVLLPWSVLGEGLGGWTLSAHHRFDPRTRVLLLGSGERFAATDAPPVAPRYAGTGVAGSTGDGGPARLARLIAPSGLALGPDGSLYIADPDDHRVRRVAPDGTMGTFAGTGAVCGQPGCGDGGPASGAPLGYPYDVEVTTDGSLLISDYACVRQVDPGGVIQTVAGTCDSSGFRPAAPLAPEGTDCEGCPATEAVLIEARGLAVAPGGGFYLADYGWNKVRFVGADGYISTVAGTGSFGFTGDGGPAVLARLAGPNGLSLGADGSLLISDTFNNRIRRIRTNGLIDTVAGDGSFGSGGDGGPAMFAQLAFPRDVEALADGSYLVADDFNQRVRRVDGDGTIRTLVENQSGSSGYVDGAPAASVYLQSAIGLAVGAEGEIFLTDMIEHHVLRISDPRPAEVTGRHLIPSRDGREVWEFDAKGRHVRTLHPLTGAALLTFGYSPAGYLETITDIDGNVTAVLRDTAGTAYRITGPYGQATDLAMDANGSLSSAIDPAGRGWNFTYSGPGLMLTSEDPNAHQATFGWELSGRLRREDDAAGGFQELHRFGPGGRSQPRYEVTYRSAENRLERFSVWNHSRGKHRWHALTTGPGAGLVTESESLKSGQSWTLFPDGSYRERRAKPDPVWGMLAPDRGEVLLDLPSMLTSSSSTTREGVLADPMNPLFLVSRHDTRTVNGRLFDSTFDAAVRRWTSTSAEGRQRRLELDVAGRATLSQVGDLLPTSFEYDSRGRLAAIVRGTGPDERRLTFDYDLLGRLETITDPLLRTVIFTYDGSNRVLTQELPGARSVGFTWDDKGNLLSLAPPGRPPHAFGYTPVDRTSLYAPPDVGGGSFETGYDYNLDRHPTAVDRPGALDLAFGYDAAQRLSSVTTSRGATAITYDPATGHVASLTTPEGNGLAYAMDGPLVLSESWSGEIAGSVERSYDVDLRLATISVNGANPVAYGYDDDGLLVQAGSLTLSRDPETGLLAGTTLGVVSTSYGYSAFGELETMTATVSGVPVYETTYTRDKLGRITTRVETIEGATTTYGYGYDLAGRLDTVTIDGVLTADYDYDANGNRTQKWTPGGAEVGSYDDQDRLLTYAGSTFTYRPSGELLTEMAGPDTTSYDYDALGNLLGVDLPDGTQIDYVVDARNRRIGRKLNGTLVQGLIWQSQLAPIAELDGTGSIVSHFVQATRVNVPDYMIRGGGTYRILADHLGSPRLVVDTTTGAVVQRVDYDEWGVVLADTNPGWMPFGFGGGLSDESSEMLRFGARDYDAVRGRWLARDPIGFGAATFNLYEYASGVPNLLTDPPGLTVLNCSDKPALVKPEDNMQPIGELAPLQEWPGSPDGVYITPDGPWYKTPGKSYLPDNDVLIGPGGTVECTSGPCSWPLLGPEELPGPPDATWSPPSPVGPLPDCKPAPEKCEQT